jgi:hypothetical protein
MTDNTPIKPDKAIIVPFKKYRGQPIEAMLADKGYRCERMTIGIGLVIGMFTAVGATLDQVRVMFSDIPIITVAEIEEKMGEIK